MKTAWHVLLGARKYWLQLGIGFAGVVLSTIAGFYLPWALRSLTQLATEGSSQFAAEALTIGLLLLGATCLNPSEHRRAGGYRDCRDVYA